jgi:hypothetical protein
MKSRSPEYTEGRVAPRGDVENWNNSYFKEALDCVTNNQHSLVALNKAMSLLLLCHYLSTAAYQASLIV